MLHLYAVVHWNIMLDEGRPRDPELLQHVFAALNWLFCFRIVFAVLALLSAAWSFKGNPRWGSMVALAFAVFAAMTILVMV